MDNLKNIGYLTKEPIDIPELLKLSHSPESGAVVLFSGEIRNNNNGQKVRYIEYEAYEKMANAIIQKILAKASKLWNLNFALCVHRTGKVEISETAVVIITSANHRQEAYLSNEYIIDLVKNEVPIWKKEFFVDGTYAWGNNLNEIQKLELSK